MHHTLLSIIPTNRDLISSRGNFRRKVREGGRFVVPPPKLWGDMGKMERLNPPSTLFVLPIAWFQVRVTSAVSLSLQLGRNSIN